MKKYTIKPKFRVWDLIEKKIEVCAGNNEYIICTGMSYADQTHAPVQIWENNKLLLEKSFPKQSEVIKIVACLPENHPLEKAICKLLEEYEARF